MGSEKFTLIHGLVLYTISDDECRSTFRSFLKEELKGDEVNESSYILPNTGDFSQRDKIHLFCKNQCFTENDFIRICFSSAMLNNDENKDKIAMYSIVEKGVLL